MYITMLISLTILQRRKNQPKYSQRNRREVQAGDGCGEGAEEEGAGERARAGDEGDGAMQCRAVRTVMMLLGAMVAY